jgi:hypothetical protein
VTWASGAVVSPRLQGFSWPQLIFYSGIPVAEELVTGCIHLDNQPVFSFPSLPLPSHFQDSIMVESDRMYGLTPPITTALPTEEEKKYNETLIQELHSQGSFESAAETQKR